MYKHQMLVIIQMANARRIFLHGVHVKVHVPMNQRSIFYLAMDHKLTSKTSSKHDLRRQTAENMLNT